jgi:hypothetical protein
MAWFPQFADVWPDRRHSGRRLSRKQFAPGVPPAHQMQNSPGKSDTFSHCQDEGGVDGFTCPGEGGVGAVTRLSLHFAN